MTVTKLKFFVGFSLEAVALYVLKDDDQPSAKNRALLLPRDPALKEADPNVQLIRTLEAAGAERVRQLIAAGVR